MSTHIKRILGFTIGIVAGVAMVFMAHTAHAGVNDNVSGWIWSDTVGWISLNCTNTNTCGTVDYGVKTTSGTFSGYAWSSNVGWISFNAADIAGCPGSCTAARLTNGVYGPITGWARIVSGMDCPGPSCASGVDDGFDGYISLSGPTYPTPVNNGTGGATKPQDTNTIVGYAWSSDIGWIHFNPNFGGAIIVNLTPPLVDMRAGDSPANIWGVTHGNIFNSSFDVGPGQSATLSWTVNSATTCTASATPADPAWSGTVSFSASTPTSLQVSPTLTTQYRLDCTGPSGNATGSVIINRIANPALNFNGATEATPTKSITSAGANAPMYFAWTAEPQFTSCTAETNKYDNATSAPLAGIATTPAWSGVNTLPSGMSLRPHGTLTMLLNEYGAFWYEFKITCSTGSGYTATRSFVVNHNLASGPLKPFLSPLTSSATTVAPNTDVYIHINAQAGQCIPTQTPAPSAGGPTGWLGIQPLVNPGWLINDYVLVHIGSQTTSLTLTCIGPRGNTDPLGTRTITITVVNAAAPTVSLSAFPATGLAPGGQTVLTYNSSDVTSCTTTPSSTPAGNGATGWDGTTLLANQTGQANVTMGTTDTIFYIDCLGTDGVTHVQAQTMVTLQKHLTLSFSNSVFLPSKTLPNATTPFDMYWWSDAPLSNCVTSSTPNTWWTTFPGPITAGVAHKATTGVGLPHNVPTATVLGMTCQDAGGATVTAQNINIVIDGPTASVQPTVSLTGPACIAPGDGGSAGDATLTLAIYDPSSVVGSCSFLIAGVPYIWSATDVDDIRDGRNDHPFSVSVPNPPNGTMTFGPVTCSSTDPLITVAPTNQITVGYNGTAAWCNPTTGGGTKGGLQYQER
jgi:hypothetical protein